MLQTESIRNAVDSCASVKAIVDDVGGCKSSRTQDMHEIVPPR